MKRILIVGLILLSAGLYSCGSSKTDANLSAADAETNEVKIDSSKRKVISQRLIWDEVNKVFILNSCVQTIKVDTIFRVGDTIWHGNARHIIRRF